MSALSHARQLSVCLVVTFVFAVPAAAVPVQITNTPSFNNFGPSVSADGNRLVFYSAADNTGGNPDDNFEIYLYDRPTSTLTQITDFPGGIFAGGNQAPQISGDGNRIVYQHFVLIPGGTVDFQTLYFDIPTSTFTTVTSQQHFFEAADINGDGTRIVVSTDNTGMRIYDTASASFGGVFGSLGSGLPRISADGTRVTWEAFNNQVRLFDTTTSTTTFVNAAGSGFNQVPAISADGRRIAYSSNANPVGSNADGNDEIFLYDVPSATTIQLTSTAAGSNHNASISGDGTRIAFSSTADITGGNADHNTEIFVYDLLSDAFSQITDSTVGFNDTPSISADGLTLAFISSSHLIGNDTGSNPEIYFETLAPHANAPAPSTLTLLAAALLALWPVAVRRPRRVRN